MNNPITLTRQEAKTILAIFDAINATSKGGLNDEFLEQFNLTSDAYDNILTTILEQLHSKAEPSYPISYVCKDDIRECFKDNKKAISKINKMDEGDMQHLANKFGEALGADGQYYDILKIVFESRFLE